MDQISFEDVVLHYELRQGGDPVLLVHAAPFVSWYEPLVARMEGVDTLRCRRQLRAQEHGRYRPLSVGEDGQILSRLMEHVGWVRAHVVGHSYGALVALQMALDWPDRVASLALLEPAARGISRSKEVAAALDPVITAYRAGDRLSAMELFLRHVGGDGFRDSLDAVLPRAFEEAVEYADLFFQAEMAAVSSWDFGPERASEISQPVLNVVGSDTVPRFVEAADLVQTWFPDAERLDVPDAGHLLMVQNPEAVATGLAAFFSRHPIGAATTAS
jgi:pimeloyl-ACP methyl ester carboxylesterase